MIRPAVMTSTRDTVMRKVVCFLLLLAASCWSTDSPVVRISHGAIRGSLMNTRLGKLILAYRGIPFAKPPIGSLRFQPPVPPDPWDGVLDASKDGAVCPPSQSGGNVELPRSEDCLFLNVYTKMHPGRKVVMKNPVIVFFHPGTWYSFSSHSLVFGPEYLLDQDVVLVTGNYRLGALGYLSTNDSVLSGNYGMKDQVAILRWVKQNIAAFGGNPNSVTISGSSAGSVSSMLHMVSPMSRGLFHRVIAASGSALSLWAVQPNPFTYAHQFARLFNCPAETSQQIKDCLLTQDAQDMADSIFRLTVWGGAPGVIFGPVIETATEGERFLVEHPMESFRSGRFAQVPIMTGVTRSEFGWVSLDILRNETMTQEFDRDLERILPYVFQYNTYPQQTHITRVLRRLYFRDRRINNSTANQLSKMFRDGIICYGEDLASKVISKSSRAPLYYYRFGYQGRYSRAYNPGTTIPYDVVHMDDLIYLFNISVVFPSFNRGDPEIKTVERMTTIWVNFAKTGNPTPRKTELLQNVNWEPFTTHNLMYMDIGSKLQMKVGLYQDTLPVWDELFYPGYDWGRVNTKG